MSAFDLSDLIVVSEGITAISAELGRIERIRRLPAALVTLVLRSTGRLRIAAL